VSRGIYKPHNWDARQFQSDASVNDRVARYRRKRTEMGLKILSDYSQFKPALISRDGEACVYCRATESLVVDHMHPISQGGTDVLLNLALACKQCNSGKAGRTPSQAGYSIHSESACNSYNEFLKLNTVTVSVTTPEQNRTEQIQNITPLPPSRNTVSLREGFDRFWAVVWRKVNKPGALKAWPAALHYAKQMLDAGQGYGEPQDPVEYLVSQAVAESQKSAIAGNDWRAQLHPATWLRGHRWEDEVVPTVLKNNRQAQFDSIMEKIT
jgi:hypothetical protein